MIFARLILPAIVALVMFGGVWLHGYQSGGEATKQDIIDTMERARNADLSEGDIADDTGVITDWLRENQ